MSDVVLFCIGVLIAQLGIIIYYLAQNYRLNKYMKKRWYE